MLSGRVADSGKFLLHAAALEGGSGPVPAHHPAALAAALAYRGGASIAASSAVRAALAQLAPAQVSWQVVTRMPYRGVPLQPSSQWCSGVAVARLERAESLVMQLLRFFQHFLNLKNNF